MERPAEPFTILLVEDNPDDSILIRRALEKTGVGHRIQWVQSGEAALSYLEGQDHFGDRLRYPLPALVLLDLRLPGLSGFDVLAWIRGHPRLRTLPVVVLTSSGDLRDVNRAYELGANSYLTKPITPAEVERMMAALHGYWLRWNRYPELAVP
ncbi:MAG: response regulator [candidate division KSB1 bacterium]|nr:response regulator [candidate division KSB1 bacterium]